MGMVLVEHRYAHFQPKQTARVIGEQVPMKPEPKEPRTLKVKRMFEADRIAPLNLQIAYEQILPTKRYRIVLPKRSDQPLEWEQEWKERSSR